uniref:Putative transcription factor grauzone n=1 Tax=Lutzomyia longipalpis TaxID=7200 RepID=A0A1B0CN90_LUTLO
MSSNVWINKCRLCLEDKTKFIDVSTSEELAEIVEKMLLGLFQISIVPEENLPQEICFDCWEKAYPMYQFRLQVIENQKLLEQQMAEEAAFYSDFVKEENETIQQEEEILEEAEILEVEEIDEAPDLHENIQEICDEGTMDDLIVEEPWTEVVEEVDQVDYDEETKEISILEESFEKASPEKTKKRQRNSELDRVIAENFPEFEKIACPLGTMTWAEKDDMVRSFVALTCKVCGEEANFDTFEDLLKHHTVKGHPGKPSVVCCNKEFSERKLLYSHLVLHLHPDTYACFVCKKRMKTKDYLKKHLFSHLPYELRPIQCDKCGKKCLGNDQLKAHMQSHESEHIVRQKPKKFRENVWEKVEEEVLVGTTMDETDRELRKFDRDRAIYEHFPGFEFLTNPQNSIAPEERDDLIRQFVVLDCKECPEQPKFNLFEELQAHYEQMGHTSRPFVRCCTKEYFRKERIITHIAIHLNPNAFACPVCHKQSQSKDLLKKHLYTHLPREARPLECAECDKRFCHKAQLRFHMASHVAPEGRKYVCDECGKGFAYQFVLDRHVKAHQRVRDYVCEVCAKAFTGRSNYLDHKMRHHDIPDPVVCPICGNKYRNNISLRSHMALHTDRREHKCETCQKVFTARAGLLAHIRYVHSDRWLYKCHICKKKIRTRVELRDHVARHTGTTTHQCEFCSKAFTSRSYYFSHRKKCHPVEHAKLPKKQKFFVLEN